MKKIKFILLFFISILCILSCSSEISEGQNNSIPQKHLKSVNPYDFIGELHNSAMDSVKSQHICAENLKKFTNEYTEISFDNVKTYPNTTLCNEILNEIVKTSCAYKYQTRSHKSIEDSIQNTIPEGIKDYINEIYNIVDTDFLDTTAIKNKFNTFDTSVVEDNSLSQEEKASVLAISSIGKYSYIYNHTTIKTRAITANGIIKSDLSGAVGGVFCWATFGKAACSGLVFGPGGIVLTIAKEATRGAIIGSAVHIVSGGFF